MGNAGVAVGRGGFGKTARVDAWWVQPAAVFLGLSAFALYAMWAGLQGKYYYFGPYLSPFYSPELFGESPHAWFGLRPSWWPSGLPFSPTMLIIAGPLGFRFTCYYYRGAYYKAFWADPLSCTVGEPRAHYRGESSLPLIIQNVHRYFMYIALAFLPILAYDVWEALWFKDAAGVPRFGIGVGTLLLAANVVLLGGYTLGCHSLRHLIGGRVDCLSRMPVRMQSYKCVSCLNRGHMYWAWTSLVAVGFCDIYIRLCAMGIWTDWRII